MKEKESGTSFKFWWRLDERRREEEKEKEEKGARVLRVPCFGNGSV
jgi:hypothetical protein